MNAPVGWRELEPENTLLIANVLEVKCEPLYDNYCLQVSNGYLIIEAPSLEAKYSSLNRGITIVDRSSDSGEISPGSFLPDYALETQDKYHVEDRETLYLLAISSCHNPKGRSMLLLVVKEVPGVKDEFWRIGLCTSYELDRAEDSWEDFWDPGGYFAYNPSKEIAEQRAFYKRFLEVVNSAERKALKIV